MLKGAPPVNKTKPSPILKEPHFTVSLPNPRHSPFNRSVWTLSRVYCPFKAMMPYSPSPITDALEVPYSYHAPPPLLEWGSPSYTLTMCTGGSDSQQNSSQTETPVSHCTSEQR